jgi:hypothetical protein
VQIQAAFKKAMAAPSAADDGTNEAPGLLDRKMWHQQLLGGRQVTYGYRIPKEHRRGEVPGLRGLLSRKQSGELAITHDPYLVPPQPKQMAVIVGSPGLLQIALVTLHVLGKLIRRYAKQDFNQLNRAVGMRMYLLVTGW